VLTTQHPLPTKFATIVDTDSKTATDGCGKETFASVSRLKGGIFQPPDQDGSL
jgi:hypothetical protein